MKLIISAFQDVEIVQSNSFLYKIRISISTGYNTPDLMPGLYFVENNEKKVFVSSQNDALSLMTFHNFLESLLTLIGESMSLSAITKLPGPQLSARQKFPFENLLRFKFPNVECANFGYGSVFASQILEDFLSFSSLAENYTSPHVPNFYTIYNALRHCFRLASQNGIFLFTMY